MATSSAVTCGYKASSNLPVAIFDGDDTLWETMALYDAAKEEFYLLMEKVGFVREDVADLLDEIDTSRVEVMGFDSKRFPGSLTETYRRLCSIAKVNPDSSVEKACVTIGERVFTEPIRPYPDAADVLSRLRGTFLIALLTKGDPAIQRQRVSESGLASMFDEVFIVPKKDADTLRSILDDKHWSAKSSWMIGNSRRSDIDPALHIGMQAIWIPRETWSYEHERHGVLSGFVVRDRLADVPDVLMKS